MRIKKEYRTTSAHSYGGLKRRIEIELMFGQVRVTCYSSSREDLPMLYISIGDQWGAFPTPEWIEGHPGKAGYIGPGESGLVAHPSQTIEEELDVIKFKSAVIQGVAQTRSSSKEHDSWKEARRQEALKGADLVEKYLLPLV